jgi:hypothetical protein
MNPISFHHLRGNLKRLFAALGVGVLATMGALTLALPTPAGSTSPDRWKADTNLTLVPEIRTGPSYRAQVIADPCLYAAPKARAHHVC